MAEQNPTEVKSPSENTKDLRLTSDIEDLASCVSFSENKALELEKQEHIPLGNMWITDNRMEQKKKRPYPEVVYNLKEDQGE